jgi:hypothetical protein
MLNPSYRTLCYSVFIQIVVLYISIMLCFVDIKIFVKGAYCPLLITDFGV